MSTDTPRWPTGHARIVLDEVDSTNAEAARIAAGLTMPTWIMAYRQRAGRGRRGRPWVMPPGNLAATLVLRPEGPPESHALHSFVAALALYDAFVAATGRVEPFGLKWPNDVLLNGRKVAGILLENLPRTAGHIAIGFGVNLAIAPGAEEVEPEALAPVALPSETGVRIGPGEFLDLLAPAFASWQARFAMDGFGPIRWAWLDRAVQRGKPIRARTMTEDLAGTFDTVDETGALILDTAEGRRAIPAADVYL